MHRDSFAENKQIASQEPIATIPSFALKTRRNGFSRPFHYKQVITWVELVASVTISVISIFSAIGIT